MKANEIDTVEINGVVYANKVQLSKFCGYSSYPCLDKFVRRHVPAAEWEQYPKGTYIAVPLLEQSITNVQEFSPQNIRISVFCASINKE